MGKRCQVCDGPIVNGRCKYCGMPYRNDMELYHLNEDRSEHYRHASAKVKKAMAESEIPLPDRNNTTLKAGKMASVRKQKTASGAQTARTQTARTQNAKVQTSKVQTSGAKKTAGQSYSEQTARTYSTGKKTIKGEKKSGKAGKIFWIIMLILIVVIGQMAEHWDTIGYRIEEFIYDEFDIDLGSIFDDSSTDEVNESNENDWMDDWSETISAVKNGQDEQKDNPDWYMFTGENYIVGTDDTAAENADTDTGDSEYDFTIDPGEYRIVSGWEKVALEIKSFSGKDETVKFDEADHEEKIELHAGDKVSVVSLDGQDNYLAMYQIQQYDE